jgi:hypothetical protein
MKTISDDEFASYLARAKKKMEAPDASVDPVSQVIVAAKLGVEVQRGGERLRPPPLPTKPLS